MKKILITILSLIAALIMCFAFVACDGDHEEPPVTPNPTDKDKPNEDDPKKPDESDEGKVSIKLNDALEVIEGVLDSKGFTATATYSLSTKNTETLTDSVSIDKRGSKIKIDDDFIIDYETGYWYEKYSDGGYRFDQNMTAGEIDYIKYLVKTFVGEDSDGEITAQYDEETKTVTFYLNLAENVNKYLDPFYTAYGKSKNLGVMLDDYSTLLFGKKFDEVYDVIEEYIKNPKNTFGSLLDLLKKEAGVDVEALLKEFGVEVPAEIMTAVKQRKLGEAVVGAYNYIKQVVGDMIGGMMPADESADIDTDDDQNYEGSDGMMSIAMGLYEAMLSSEVTEDQIKAGLAEIKSMLPMLKELSVKTLVDTALAEDKDLAELYTVIQDGVKFNDISMTLTLTVDDNKTVTGVKVDLLTTHTYTGEAPESYVFLSDNDYLISAELKIEEYKTEVEAFDIQFSPIATYKRSVAQLVYEVTDKGVSVYYETAGNKINIENVMFEVETPDGVETDLEDVSKDAFKFDEETSSFVFDAAFVKSVLENATAGTKLTAFVHFDEEDYVWYGVTLVYLNDDIDEVSDYLTNYFMELIKNMGGNDMPGDTNVSTPQE